MTTSTGNFDGGCFRLLTDKETGMHFIYINCTLPPCLRPVPYIWICQWNVGALICGAQVSSVRYAGSKFHFDMHCGIVLSNFRMSHVCVKQSRYIIVS